MTDAEVKTFVLLTGAIFFTLVVLGILSPQRLLFMGYVILLACAGFVSGVLIHLGIV